MPKIITRTVLLRRVRDHGPRKHVTLWWAFVDAARATGKPLDQVMPEHMPAFDPVGGGEQVGGGEVEEGWFLIERVPRGSGHPWPYWRAVRPVEPPPGR